MRENENKIIVDTDIGEDIDDTWALVFLLSSRFVDIELISVSTGDVRYKAKIVAKILTLLKKTYIPIVLGKSTKNECYAQKGWVEDFNLDNYDGVIYDNAYDAYKDVLKKDTLVVELAPFSTLSEVKPLLVDKNVRILAMAGSVYKGYFDSDIPSPECNVVTDIPAIKNIFNSKLPITLVPLDVCGNIIINDKQYQSLKKSRAVPAQIVMENYRIWQKDYEGGAKKLNISIESSYLYDLCAVWPVLFSQNFDKSILPIKITSDGMTIVSGRRNVTVITKMHKKDAMIDSSIELFRTNTEKSRDILKVGINGMYSLSYILHSPNTSLSVVETGWEQRRPGSSFGSLAREYYILHAVTSGKGTFYVGDKKKEFKAGDCFVVPPFKPVKYNADENDPCKYYWVGYTGTTAKELTLKAGFNKDNNYVLTPKNFKLISDYIKMMSHMSENDKAVPYFLLGNLYVVFSKFLESELEQEQEEMDYVERAIQYIDMHYFENISIQDVSRYVALDRTYLFRLFREKTNQSPKDYLTNVRIEAAKKLLIDTNMPINNISSSVGYSNYISFFNIFQAKVNATPSEFREKSKKKQHKYKSTQQK